MKNCDSEDEEVCDHQFNESIGSFDFAKEEENILKFWIDNDAFKTQLKLSKNRKRFNFYDGPPFATGLPHYGHILAGTIKDTITRWATQTGHYVERRFGWDCHGLPVEYEIDKKLKIKGPSDVLKMGVDVYNNECRKIVMCYSKEWEQTISRLGRWIDFENDYKTLYPSFMESVWWVFKQLYEKNMIYRGYKVMPYSTSCCTSLSNFEATQNYQDKQDPAIFVIFKAIDEDDKDLGYSFLAWTTTPWTLPSNLALCMHPDLDYVKVKDKTHNSKIFILAESRLKHFYKSENDYEILDKSKGLAFKGIRYRPIFDYFVNIVDKKCAFRVLTDSYVTGESGTGIVHQAPYFGEDDFRVCLEAKIINKTGPIVCPVDESGNFTSEVNDFAGKYVKDADKFIIKYLKDNDHLYSQSTIQHQYPFCWRSNTPLIYKAVPSWFVKVEDLKDKLVENNSKTYWVPEYAKEKRFGNWLSDARDWAISRNRFWGNPIPLWVSDDFEEIVCIGSIEELKTLSGVQNIEDLHKEHVDKITIPSKMNKGVLRRIPEVFDCWFESGSMPYAQLHYPFENKKEFEECFPAEFIAEGMDQTRGWFYTLLVISTAIFNKPPFKNVIANGIILTSEGQKMSKSKKNFSDPIDVINKYGADSIRLYLITSPAVRGDSFKFNENDVKDVVKEALLRWHHASKFLIQNIEIWERNTNKKFVYEQLDSYNGENILDKWILYSIQSLIKFVRTEMALYKLYTVLPRLVKFIDTLCNWYLRLNRRNLRGENGIQESFLAINTTCNIFYLMLRLFSPFVPFLTESMYQKLKKYLEPKSNDLEYVTIHYQSIPDFNENLNYSETEIPVNLMQKIIILARKIRDDNKIPLRHPLKELIVLSDNYKLISEAVKQVEPYIMDELSIKKLTVAESKENYGVELRCKPNFAVLASKAKNEMKNLKDLILKMNSIQVEELKKNGKLVLDTFELTLDDVKISPTISSKFSHYHCHFDEDLIVLLNTNSDEELVNEGVLKDVANRVQRIRKLARIAPTDDITVYFKVEPAESKLNTLLKNSTEFVEKIIKKTFKEYQNDVCFTQKENSYQFLDAMLKIWVAKN